MMGLDIGAALLAMTLHVPDKTPEQAGTVGS